MRIGLTGAQGVGKSTLARALAEKLGLPLIEEQARVVARDMGLENPRALKGQAPELGRLFQYRCLTYQIREEQKYVSSGQGYISDRTVIDNAVYWLKWHQHGAESFDNLNYYKSVEEYAKNYDLVVYVPIEETPADDGFRSTNIHYQEEIAFLVRAMLAAYGVQYMTVTGTAEERLAQVLQRLAVVT